MEQLSPYELAQRVMNTPLTMEQQEIHIPGIFDMLKNSESVWRQLKNGQFEQDEYGYVTLRVLDYESDYTNWRGSGDNVDGIVVFHNAPSGFKTELGGIYKVKPSAGKVIARSSANRKETIDPNDTRWDAIVGTIGRAITRCMLEKGAS